jgi:hypothetical protein
MQAALLPPGPWSSRFFFCKLKPVQLRIIAIIQHQLFVRALLRQLPIVEHDDIVKAKSREDPVGDHQGCFIMQVPVQVANDLVLCFGIHSAQAVIENNDARVLDQRPCNGDPLLLSATQRYAPLSYHGGKAMIETLYLFLNAGEARSLFYAFLACRARKPETDIVSNRIAEEEYILLHIADLFPQCLQVYFFKSCPPMVIWPVPGS